MNQSPTQNYHLVAISTCVHEIAIYTHTLECTSRRNVWTRSSRNSQKILSIDQPTFRPNITTLASIIIDPDLLFYPCTPNITRSTQSRMREQSQFWFSFSPALPWCLIIPSATSSGSFHFYSASISFAHPGLLLQSSSIHHYALARS